MAVDYKELLNEKVQDEYESFIAELKGMPSEKVIEHAYEKVIKEDLVICIENGDFSRAEAKALYQKKCPLDFVIVNGWKQIAAIWICLSVRLMKPQTEHIGK